MAITHSYKINNEIRKENEKKYTNKMQKAIRNFAYAYYTF